MNAEDAGATAMTPEQAFNMGKTLGFHHAVSYYITTVCIGLTRHAERNYGFPLPALRRGPSQDALEEG